MSPASDVSDGVAAVDGPRRRALQLLGLVGVPFVLPLSAGRADAAVGPQLRDRDDDERSRTRSANAALNDVVDALDDLRSELEAVLDAVDRLDEDRGFDDESVDDAADLLDEAEERLRDARGFVSDLDWSFRRGRSGSRRDIRDDAVDELLDVVALVEEAIEVLDGEDADDDDLDDDELDDLFDEAEERIEDAEDARAALDDAIDESRRFDYDRDERGALSDARSASRSISRLLDRTERAVDDDDLGEAEEYLDEAIDWAEFALDAFDDL
ncbi:hypothetical protein ACFO0N_08125 [Halobium salinum]|uniref:Uncharacterized protein n=1 Tax=Halobium salinum TaxID=1364940 RepID=A0ABD5PAK7_9EURY|nr:hypothetical protein [Halobium salinum]